MPLFFTIVLCMYVLEITSCPYILLSCPYILWYSCVRTHVCVCTRNYVLSIHNLVHVRTHACAHPTYNSIYLTTNTYFIRRRKEIYLLLSPFISQPETKECLWPTYNFTSLTMNTSFIMRKRFIFSHLLYPSWKHKPTTRLQATSKSEQIKTSQSWLPGT